MEEGQATEQPSVEDRLAAFINPVEEQPEQEAQEAAPQEEQEEQPQEEESPLTIDYEAPLFEVTVKVEGGGSEVKKVSLKDLESGYMMQSDYQRKTAELARARETMTQEVQKTVEPMRQQYIQNLQQLQTVVQSLVMPELQGVNLEQLASENPAEYVKVTAKFQKVQQALQQAQWAQQQEAQRAFQQQAEESRQILSDPVRGIPGWSNEVYQGIISEGSRSYGFSPEEVAGVVDHRMIKVLHDALQYQKISKSKPIVEKKVSVAPKVLKPGAPTSGAETQAKEVKDLRARVKKSGDIKDAAALYQKMFM